VKLWVIVAFLGILGTICYAAGTTNKGADTLGASSDSIVVLGPMTVFGLKPLTTSSAEDALLQIGRIPGGASVRPADQFQEGPARSLTDLLKCIPGVRCESEGTQTGKVSIRGSGIQADDGPIGIQFLLDGIPVNDAEGEADVDDYDLRSVHHAEIYKGANSLDNGAYTLGGAINLVPPTGYDAGLPDIKFDGGEFGEAAANVSAGSVKGPIDWYGSVGGRRGNGYRVHSAQQGGNFFGDLGWRLAPGMENRFYLTAVDIDRQLPGGLSHDEVAADSRQADPDSAVSQNFGSREANARIADRLTFVNNTGKTDVGAYWSFRNEESRSYFGGESRDGIYDFTDNNIGASVKYAAGQKFLNRQCDLAGGAAVAYENEDGTNYANVGGARGIRTGSGIRTALNAPLHGSVQISLVKNCVAMAACQAVFAQRRFVDRAAVSAGSDPDDAPGHTLDFFGVNPKLGLRCGDDDAQAFVNVSRSWQPPSFDAMVEIDSAAGSGYEFTPLKPQQAWTAETGLRGEQGAAQWDLCVYRAWVRNELLEMNDAHGSDIGTVNVAATIHQGVEAGVDLDLCKLFIRHARDNRPSNRIVLNQSYTFSDFYFDNDPVYGFNRIAGIPVHVYETQLRFESTAGFFAGTQMQWSLARFPADQANTLFADPYAVFGFSIGYHVARGASVYLEVRNVSDKRYAAGVTPIPDARTADGPARVFQPGEGRSFFGGIGWKW
jgi:iron complex outermembrane receptor protein